MSQPNQHDHEPIHLTHVYPTHDPESDELEHRTDNGLACWCVPRVQVEMSDGEQVNVIVHNGGKADN
jgi:hypothetical protein